MNITVMVGHPGWLRGQATYADGWLTLEKPDVYLVEHAPDLPFTLAGIRTPAEAVKCVESSGLLRLGMDATEHRERFTDWQQTALELVETMDLYMVFRAARQGHPEGLNRLRELVARATGQPSDNEAAKVVVDSAEIGLADRLRRGTGQVECEIMPGVVTGHNLSWTVVPKTLLSVVYHQLAGLIFTDREFRYCMDCGRVFLVGNLNQRFCNNTCASRHRYHRKAERQRRDRQDALKASQEIGALDSAPGVP